MIVADASHLDHALSLAHLAWLRERFAGRTGFFIETVELPPELPSLVCALHGPMMGDAPVVEAEAIYARRGSRAGDSRLCARSARWTRQITVVAGPHGDEPCVLYTAYGGPAAPREPWDPTLDGARRAEAEAFWSQHALSRVSDRVFVNATPHEVRVLDSDRRPLLVLPPSGQVARCAESWESLDGLFRRPKRGAVEGLPEPRLGQVIVVSAMAREAANRADVVSPGPLVRDERGQPVGCLGLAADAVPPAQ